MNGDHCEAIDIQPFQNGQQLTVNDGMLSGRCRMVRGIDSYAWVQWTQTSCRRDFDDMAYNCGEDLNVMSVNVR